MWSVPFAYLYSAVGAVKRMFTIVHMWMMCSVSTWPSEGPRLGNDADQHPDLSPATKITYWRLVPNRTVLVYLPGATFGNEKAKEAISQRSTCQFNKGICEASHGAVCPR